MNELTTNIKFVKEFAATAANMYRLGWDERNGGNISYLIPEEEVAEYFDLTQVRRTIPLGFDAHELIGKYWVLLATAGLWSIAIGVAIIIATKNEDKAKAKKMLVNHLIGLVVIFVIVVACPYLVRGIAAFVT